MKNNEIIKYRVIFILMMLLAPLFAGAKVMQEDSVYVDDSENQFILMHKHLKRGCELELEEQYRAALKEFGEGIAICERLKLLDYYGHEGKHWMFSITVPLYAMSASLYSNLGETDEALLNCRKAMNWIELWDDVKKREPYAYALSMIMMKYRRLEMTHDLLARTYKDATLLEQHDHALMCATCLMEIEDVLYTTRPKDNPWIERGKIHYEGAANVETKSFFLSFLRKIYQKANLIDEARKLEMQLKQARRYGGSPFDVDAKITPYDSAFFKDSPLTLMPGRDKKLLAQADSAGNDANKDDASVSEKIRYIYQQHYGWVISIASVLLIVVLLFIAYAIRQRYIRRHTLQEAEQEQNRRYLEGMENERTRLAKELHDGVSNQLLAIEMKLNDNTNGNENLIPHTSNLKPNTDRKWEQARRMLKESREQVRRVSHELMPPEFAFAHLGEVVEDFIEYMDGTNGIAMHFESKAKDECYKSIPPAHALEIYRIVQEAMANAVKHADPKDIFVMIKDEGDTMNIRITDNGTPRQGGTHGIGLRTMSQRADAIGATLTIDRITYATVVTLRYVKKK